MNNQKKKIFLGYYHYGVVLTYLSVASAIVGIYFSVGGNKEAQPAIGVICLLISGICDAFDGIVARTRKNRTREDKMFGARIDSLSDMIAFGLAPTAIMFGMGINRWYFLPIFILYVLCALIRLAYFDVTEILRIEKEDAGKREFYEGLPVTNAAIIIPLCYLVATLFQVNSLGYVLTMLIGYIVVALAFIMPFRVTKLGVKGILKLIIVVTIVLGLLIALKLGVCN